MIVSRETNVAFRVFVPMETLKTKWGQFPGPQIPECGHCREKCVNFLSRVLGSFRGHSTARVLKRKRVKEDEEGQGWILVEHFFSARIWTEPYITRTCTYTHIHTHTISLNPLNEPLQ